MEGDQDNSTKKT